MKTKRLAYSAVIAALYACASIFLPAISYGPVQVRISEALCPIASLSLNTVPALSIGCFLANLYSGNIIDIIFGTLTTLVASLVSYKLRNKLCLVPLPHVLLNAVIVGGYLTLQYGGLVWMNMLTVGIGQLISCYIIGLPLCIFAKKNVNFE